MPETGAKPPRSAPDSIPSLLFPSQADWETWLQENHAGSGGVWLRLARKNARVQTVSYAEALESALCYGWIDGQKQSGSEGFWLQRFTPRRASSIWSKVNREKALALIKQGRMHTAGLEAIETARKNGRWDSAYDAVSVAEVPEDLAAELRSRPRAKAFFQTLSSQNRYAILFRLQTAMKPETRAKRLAQFVSMLENQQTIYPQSRAFGARRQKS